MTHLAREARTGGMDPFPVRLEDPGDRILGEPVDLEVRVQPAQFPRDRDVASRVTESDWR